MIMIIVVLTSTGWWFELSWKIWVRQWGWDYDIPNMMEKNHPFMFQTTNQIKYVGSYVQISMRY